MELERGGLSEGEDCSAPGEDGGFRAYCLGTSSKPWSSGWGVYVCLCDRCIRFPVARDKKKIRAEGESLVEPKGGAASVTEVRGAAAGQACLHAAVPWQIG